MEFGSRLSLGGFTVSRGTGLALASLPLAMPVAACGESSRESMWRRHLLQGPPE